MGAEDIYLDIVAGWGGVWTAPVRGALALPAAVYGRIVERRNRGYDTGRREVVRLPVPVISIGNVTTGGTGKTPLVLDIAGRFLRRGRRPAVVARGYRAGHDGLADEPEMISELLPGVPCVTNGDRVAGGHDAMKLGADVIVLDDGFQHRRIARDADFVVVDATNPFGFDHVLPRGLLREPIGGLRRATLFVISRCDQADATTVEAIIGRLRVITPETPCVRSRHRPLGLHALSGASSQDQYDRAIVFAAIGNRRAFAHTVSRMGMTVAAERWWPDHHAYRPQDIRALVRLRERVEHDVVITTRKDAVKLRKLDVQPLEPLRVLDIEIEYLDGGDTVIDDHLGGVLDASRPSAAAEAPLRCSL